MIYNLRLWRRVTPVQMALWKPPAYVLCTSIARRLLKKIRQTELGDKAPASSENAAQVKLSLSPS